MATQFLVMDDSVAGLKPSISSLMGDDFTLWLPFYFGRTKVHCFVDASPYCRWELFKKGGLKGDITFGAADRVRCCLTYSSMGCMVHPLKGWGFSYTTTDVSTAKPLSFTTFLGEVLVLWGLG